MKLATILLLLTFSQASVAQLYSFRPKYACQIIHSGGDEQPNTWFDRVTKAGPDTLVVDLDNKTLSFPWGNFPGQRTIPITGVEHDMENSIYILKTTASKDAGQVWRYYELKLDEKDEPVYLKQVERLTGKRFAKDTFFQVYTQDLGAVFFLMQSSHIKQNLALNADTAILNREVDAIYQVPFGEGENTVEMRNGYILWTEGKGKKALQHQFTITKVSLMEDDGYNCILVRCNDEHGTVYFVQYLYTRRKMEPKAAMPGRKRIIIIIKQEKGITTGYTMLR